MHGRVIRPPFTWVLIGVVAAGCATTTPYVGQGPHPQISRGQPVPPIDFLGNVLGLPAKLVLWSWKMDNHAIAQSTEDVLIAYLDAPRHPAVLKDAHFRLNEYRPVDDLKRLWKNRHVAWPFRLLLGLPTTLVFEVLLPGRLGIPREVQRVADKIRHILDGAFLVVMREDHRVALPLQNRDLLLQQRVVRRLMAVAIPIAITFD